MTKKELQFHIFKWVAIHVLIFALIVIGYTTCNRSTENKYIQENIKQKTEILKINDSISVLKQQLLLSETRANLVPNNDSIILEALKTSKISPNTISMWKSVFSGTQKTIKLNDSLNSKLAQILQSQKDLLLSSDLDKSKIQEEYNKNLKTLLASRIKFQDSSKYRILKGDIGFDSKLNIEQDQVISEPFVIFGEKNRFLGLGKSEYSVVIGDKNPNIKQENAYSATYKPKSKLEVSLGPVVTFSKSSLNIGAAVTFKKGILSFTTGYNLIQTRF